MAGGRGLLLVAAKGGKILIIILPLLLVEQGRGVVNITSFPRLCVLHDSFTLIHICDMTHSYPFIFVT